MTNWDGVNKHCPGCCEPGETIPIKEFTRSTVTSDGRSKLCIDCQKLKLQDLPAKEEKPKQKEQPLPVETTIKSNHKNIKAWIDGKIDHPSKPLPEISAKKEKVIPTLATEKKDKYVPEPESQGLIREECNHIMTVLLNKNRKYGDSAIHPRRLFSKADAIEQINVRLDDKISRLESGQADEDEDVELDIIGYLMLKRVAKRVYEGAK